MRLVVVVLLVLAVAAGVSGVARYSYNLGIAQGVAQSGHPAASGQTPAVAYPYGGPFQGPLGFGVFGFLWPVLLVLLIFGFARQMRWRGRGWGGSCGGGAPRWLEEWHRRAHESQGGAGTV